MNYLRSVEHTEENLKFLLWYKDYKRRFFELPPEEQAKSPMWLPGDENKHDVKLLQPGSRSRSWSVVGNIEPSVSSDSIPLNPLPPPSPGFHLKPFEIRLEDGI